MDYDMNDRTFPASNITTGKYRKDPNSMTRSQPLYIPGGERQVRLR